MGLTLYMPQLVDPVHSRPILELDPPRRNDDAGVQTFSVVGKQPICLISLDNRTWRGLYCTSFESVLKKKNPNVVTLSETSKTNAFRLVVVAGRCFHRLTFSVTMIPASSYRRRTLGRPFLESKNNNNGDRSSMPNNNNRVFRPKQGGWPIGAIPTPPLFSLSTDETQEQLKKNDTFNVSIKEKQEKRGSFQSFKPLTNANTGFVPIEPPPGMEKKSRASSARAVTPPLSPMAVCKPVKSFASPGISPYSVAPTEDSTERTLTPVTPVSYLHAASSSFSPGTKGSRPLLSPKAAHASTGSYTNVSSPRKSPTKYGRRPFSPNSPFVPYSPGASSVGSNTQPNTAEEVVRKHRIKTEMCMHYSNGRVCPFGVNCTYAHGEEELQMTKLMDLQRAGLIEDALTYRTRPCFTHVSTGSCPFGKRCSFIHDPRVNGNHSSWLPHTETQGNSISTDINVDGLHQKRLNEILQGNPFGDHFVVGMDDFVDLYKTICNTTPGNRRRRNVLPEVLKLSIALHMRGTHKWMYKYRPQHLIYGELCMVLQKRAFRIDEDGEAVPISLSYYNSKNNEHVLVRELAFGPDSDATVRGVSLWFNIPDSEVSQCTAKQAKRFRWKKQPKFDDERALEVRPSVFNTRECFVMIRPTDRVSFDFATKVMRHRLGTVRAERLSSLSERSASLKLRNAEKLELQDDFASLRRQWSKWAWPINTGRQRVDETTKVPPVDGNYNPLPDDAIDHDTASIGSFGALVEAPVESILPIWESFVITTESADGNDKETLASGRRLDIFKRLASGTEVAMKRSLPHIRSTRGKRQVDIGEDTSNNADDLIRRESDRCWKSLLLDTIHDRGIRDRQANEWEVVREHFENSRSRKVLTILQQ